MQRELDKIKKLWNTHLIRHARCWDQINGVPNELFYIPEVWGKWNHFILHLQNFISLFNQGFQNYKCVVDELDQIFSSQYSQETPCPVPEEFIELAAILMESLGSQYLYYSLINQTLCKERVWQTWHRALVLLSQCACNNNHCLASVAITFLLRSCDVAPLCVV